MSTARLSPQPQPAVPVAPLKPTVLQALAARVVLPVFRRLKVGALRLTTPDGAEHSFGDPAHPLQAAMEVRDWRFFTRVAMNSDIGFGEAWTEGDWTTDNLHDVLLVLLENMEHTAERGIISARLGQIYDRVRHFANRNTLQGSRKNISYHYDLSNDFYAQMLDPTMTYSCALWTREGQSLEQAQRNKIRALLESLDLQPGEHLLEIGSGWGELAITAARDYGVRVTTITLSKEQLAAVRKRVKAAGLQDRIRPLLRDYRKMEGQFDKIVSVEMIEAVGHEFLGTYFAAVDRLLKPDGLVALQVITLPETRYEQYRRSVDWIQKYIFPGAVCPSLTAMTEAMAASSTLMVEDVRNIGPHYARTLKIWRDAVAANWPKIRPLGFDDRFRRMWDYYLTYCEVGFEVRQLGTLQMTLTRPHNTRLGCYRPPVMAFCGGGAVNQTVGNSEHSF